MTHIDGRIQTQLRPVRLTVDYLDKTFSNSGVKPNIIVRFSFEKVTFFIFYNIIEPTFRTFIQKLYRFVRRAIPRRLKSTDARAEGII